VIVRVLVAVSTGVALWLSPATVPVAPAGVELVSDPMFDSVGDAGGSPWQCDASTSAADGPPIGSEFTQVIGERDGDVPGHVPATPVEPPRQLFGGPTADSVAGCAQVVPVQPGATYELSATVRGGPAVLGTEYGSVDNAGKSRAKTLRTTFTVAGDKDTVRIVVHGVTGGAPYDAWGVSLVGPPSRVRAPQQPPTKLRTDRRTSRTVLLAWRSSPGAASYRVLRDGVPVLTTTETSAIVTGLTPNGSPTLTVTALNPGGESAASAPLTVAALPAWTSPPDTPTGVEVISGRPGRTVVQFTAPPRVTDGYDVSVDGVRVGWMYESPATLFDLADGTHTVTVTALNAVGASAPSAPVQVVVGAD
jgi:hypothetical protein